MIIIGIQGTYQDSAELVFEIHREIENCFKFFNGNDGSISQIVENAPERCKVLVIGSILTEADKLEIEKLGGRVYAPSGDYRADKTKILGDYKGEVGIRIE